MTNEEMDLIQLVRTAIANRVSHNSPFDKEMLVRDVLKKQKPASTAFDDACRFYALNDLVSRAVRMFEKPDTAAKNQLVLNGYEHLQSFYTVKREGVQLYIPLSLMTDDEIDFKANEHEMQAAGHIAHARELRQYKIKRRS